MSLHMTHVGVKFSWDYPWFICQEVNFLKNLWQRERRQAKEKAKAESLVFIVGVFLQIFLTKFFCCFQQTFKS